MVASSVCFHTYENITSKFVMCLTVVVLILRVTRKSGLNTVGRLWVSAFMLKTRYLHLIARW